MSVKHNENTVLCKKANVTLNVQCNAVNHKTDTIDEAAY